MPQGRMNAQVAGRRAPIAAEVDDVPPQQLNPQLKPVGSGAMALLPLKRPLHLSWRRTNQSNAAQHQTPMAFILPGPNLHEPLPTRDAVDEPQPEQPAVPFTSFSTRC